MSPEQEEQFDRAARQLGEDLAKDKADAMPAQLTDGAFFAPERFYRASEEYGNASVIYGRIIKNRYYDRDLPGGCYTPEQARAAMQAAQKRP